MTLAIIGTLSTVLLFSVSHAREKARDSTRLNDLRQLEESLEYYASIKGGYPYISGEGVTSAYQNLTGLLDPEFIPEIPADPLNGADCATCYQYHSVGTNQVPKSGYILIVALESYEEYPFCYIVGGDYPAPTVGTWPDNQGTFNGKIVGNDCRNLTR